MTPVKVEISMKNSKTLSALSLLVAALVAGPACAAELPKEGRYDIKTCFVRNSTFIEFSKTHFAYSYEETGKVVSTPAGGLFDQEEVRCVGMTASFEGQRSGGAVCIAVAQDGDRRLTRFTYDGNGRLVRAAVSGTGKYEGLLLTDSTVRSVGPAADVRALKSEACNQQTGSYKLQ